MKANHPYRVLSFFLTAAYLLAACRGVPFQSTDIASSSLSLHVSRLPGFSFTQVAGNMEGKIFGAVKAIASEAITVNGVTFSLASFRKIEEVLLVGDQVKLHGIVSGDGTFIVHEIEKPAASFDDHGSWSESAHGQNHHANNDYSHDHSNDDCHGGHGGGHYGSGDD